MKRLAACRCPREAIALLSLVLLPAALDAAPVTVPTTPTADSGPAALRTEDGKILLRLDEAVEIALRRNLALAIERLNNQQFRLGINQELGIFDLRLDGFAQWSDSSSATASALEGADVREDETQVWNLGLAQLTPIGGELAVDFNNSRFETNSTFVTLNPSFNSSLQLSYTLPLLRNFGAETTRRGLLSARLAAAGSRQFYEQQVAALIQQVENAYWDLVEAQNQLTVARESLALAEELHRRNRVQVEVGTLPPLELVQSEATIASRQVDIINARTAVGNAADQLLLLLNVDQGAAWESEIVAETDARTASIEPVLAQAIETALAERPELARQQREAERLQLEARFARNQVRPQLNLGLSYGYRGLGGDVVIRDPETQEVIEVIPGGYSDAVDQIRERDFDNWALSLLFAMPLQNRAAKASAASAGLEAEQGETQLALLRQQVITEVRTAVRQVLAAAEGIRSAEVSRVLQERNLEAEQKRYENGMSTSFQVTQIQEDLTQARSLEVTAIASYRRALTEYHRAIGRLLEETGVELIDPQG